MEHNLAKTTIELLLQSVKEQYSNNLAYHNLNHIREMLTQVSCSSYTIGVYYPDIDWEVLVQSILWHDAKYLPGNKLNEYNAVCEYMNFYRENAKVEVIEAIISTIPFYNKGFSTSEQKILHDLDWFGFMEYNKMIENEENIIKEASEYLNLPVSLVKSKQLDFYKKIIAQKQPLYVTTVWGEYNEKALNNVKRRIVELENKFSPKLFDFDPTI